MQFTITNACVTCNKIGTKLAKLNSNDLSSNNANINASLEDIGNPNTIKGNKALIDPALLAVSALIKDRKLSFLLIIFSKK